jgi:hypothetical protein
MPAPDPKPAPAIAPLKKGDRVRVQCAGYIYEGTLAADDDGKSPTLNVANLGEVERARVRSK